MASPRNTNISSSGKFAAYVGS